jgi:hypothetical protein
MTEVVAPPPLAPTVGGWGADLRRTPVPAPAPDESP